MCIVIVVGIIFNIDTQISLDFKNRTRYFLFVENNLLTLHFILQGKSLGAKQDPRNVLEMMRAWKNDLNDEEEDEEVVKKEDDNNNTGAINGESVTPPKPAKTPGSASSVRRPGSSTGKKGKVSKVNM